jgi:branched-chain amino acid transport system permease protein
MPATRFAQSGNYKTTYRQDQGIFSGHKELIWMGLLLLGLALAPMVAPRTLLRDLDLIMIFSIAALGLNITTGYTGLINMGQGAFMGVGAYAGVVAANAWNLNVFAALLVGGLSAALVGGVVGLPSLRLKHLYLAVATLAFQEIFTWGVGHSRTLAQGGAVPTPSVTLLGFKDSFLTHNLFWYYVILPVLVLLFFLWRNVMRGKHGRSLIAIRDNDRAAAAMGINPAQAKLTSFMLGSFYAGVAGVLFAYFSKSVVIEDYGLNVGVQLLAMTIVGGLGSIPGSVFGPAFIIFLDRVMEQLANWLGGLNLLPSGVDVATALRPLSFGLAIMLFLMFQPHGLASWWDKLRQYVTRWPYK